MGMYDWVMGDGEQGKRLNVAGSLLGLKSLREFGRPRDAWFESWDGMLVIAVYTRNGGGNREDYVTEIETMRAHPMFHSDADDAFDSTYATFYFEVPDRPPPHVMSGMEAVQTNWDAVVTRLRELAVPKRDMSTEWQAAIASIHSDTTLGTNLRSDGSTT